METIRLTRQQVRLVDQWAINTLNLPGLVLMENAGINAAAAVLDVLDDPLETHPTDASVAIICGGGNNGGDGYVIARQLHLWGVPVEVWSTKAVHDLTGDAAVNARACARLGLTIHPLHNADDRRKAAAAWDDCDVLVDALLGTGFADQLRDDAIALIKTINEAAHPLIIAIDVPSGLDCDTGKPCPVAVEADLTVTFVATKVGFDQPGAAQYLGTIREADIGVPVEAALQWLKEAGHLPGQSSGEGM